MDAREGSQTRGGLEVAWTLLNGVVTHYREAYDTATVLAALQDD